MRILYIFILFILIISVSGCIINIGNPINTPIPSQVPEFSNSIVGTWVTNASLGGYLFYSDNTLTFVSYNGEVSDFGGDPYHPTNLKPMGPAVYSYGTWAMVGDNLYRFILTHGGPYDYSNVSPSYEICLKSDHTFYFTRINTGNGWENLNAGSSFFKKSDYPDSELVLYQG